MIVLLFSVILSSVNVKMMFPWSQSRNFLSSFSFAWTWMGEWGLAIRSNKCKCLTDSNIFCCRQQASNPPVVGVRNLGVHVPLVTELQIECEYNQAVSIHGPAVFLRRIHSQFGTTSPYQIVAALWVCHVMNLPSEGPTHCNTASEMPPQRPHQYHLFPSCSHPDFENF